MRNLRFSTGVFLVLLVASLFLMLQIFWGFMTPIIMALVLVSLFQPVYAYGVKRLKGRRHLSGTLVTGLIFFCVVIPAFFFTATLAQQALAFYESTLQANIIPDVTAFFSSDNPTIVQFREWISSFGIELSADKIIETITSFVQSIGLAIYKSLSSILSNAVLIILNFIIMVVIVYTLFVTGGGLKQYVMDILPLADQEKERLITRFREISSAVFIGNGLVSVAEGFLGGLGFYFFGFGQPFFWGVVIGFTAFLPVIGISIVVVPAAIIMLVQGKTSLAIVFLIYNGTYAFILEYLVKPKLIGEKTHMHAVLVFLSILGGIQVYGILGLFYGPLVVTMFLSLAEIYRENYRRQLMEGK